MRYFLCASLFVCLLNSVAFSKEPQKREFQVVFLTPETLGIRPDDGSDVAANMKARTPINLSYDTVHQFIVSLGEAKDVMKCKVLVQSGNQKVEDHLEHCAISIGFVFEDLQQIDKGKSVFKIYRFDESIINAIGVVRTNEKKTIVDLIAECGTRNTVMYMELVPNQRKLPHP